MRKETNDLELAGIIAEDGRLDRPLGEDLLEVPEEVEVHGEDLVWKNRVRHETEVSALGKPSVQPGRTLLWDFIALADGPPERILKYARKWGVLNACKDHNLPASHGPLPYDTGAGRCVPRNQRVGDWLECCEPLAVWWNFAREARALLKVAAQLHLGKKGEKADWQQALASWEPYGRRIWETFQDSYKRPSPPYPVEVGRMSIANHVNWWLGLADVRPLFAWSHFDPAFVSLGGTGIKLGHRQQLFGAIAVQLMLAISRSDGLAICSSCATPYFPKRRPRPGQRNYCTGPSCGRKAADRDAHRRYYAKTRTSSKTKNRK